MHNSLYLSTETV